MLKPTDSATAPCFSVLGLKASCGFLLEIINKTMNFQAFSDFFETKINLVIVVVEIRARNVTFRDKQQTQIT